jgi:hypothetical protein
MEKRGFGRIPSLARGGEALRGNRERPVSPVRPVGPISQIHYQPNDVIKRIRMVKGNGKIQSPGPNQANQKRNARIGTALHFNLIHATKLQT